MQPVRHTIGPMKKPPAPLRLLMCCTLFLAGCNSYNRDVISVGLSVELNGIKRAEDGTVTVAWNMVNPNVTSYLLSRVSNKIFLNGTLVGTTVDAEPMAVPARQSVGKVSKLTLAGPGAERLIAEAVVQGRAAYRVDSQLIILLYGDVTEKGALTHAGSVPVAGK